MKKSIIAVTTNFLNENGIPFYTQKRDNVTTILLGGMAFSLEFHNKQNKPHTYDGKELFASIPECVVFNYGTESIAILSNYDAVIGELNRSLNLIQQAC